ncbi:DNA damage response protein kinase DUN1 [Cytospora mali]|uniref:non-specific serine/threonine protein kinase n=1 Tax=Cytospora mali TaxID=578113 RepID=A0A194W3C9_CYTMA|nr:DNA damage response protein kinase DUN1 [Valsa mali]
MADPDLIARVYPDNRHEKHALQTIEASSRYRPAKIASQEAQYVHLSRTARDSTEPPEDTHDEAPDTLPCIELRFSDPPRTSSGLVFGTDPATSDVVLPSLRGISRRHFALTFKNTFDDGYNRLVVRDLGSTYGTMVTYNGKGDKVRSNFDWITNGFRLPDHTKQIIVQLHEHIKFRIIISSHDIASPAYIADVKRFRQGAANPQDLLGGLGFQSGPATERNSGAQTPVIKRPVLLPLGRIASGGFGVVSRYWNVSTGEEYACKRPREKYDRKTWEKEIDIMKKISHEHIVRLCFSRIEPRPLLYMEYMPFGNLDDQYKLVQFSHDESLAILHQSLSALVYLHGQPQPVAHRDIKPENILVKYRDRSNPSHLHIKLSDFGLSKTGSLKTWCGTESYLPPEIREDRAPLTYTKAVDIWSLGVVMLWVAYGLPYPGSGIGIEWCEKIVKEANSWESEGLIDILQHMLVIEAEARYSAEACWREASRLVTSSQDRSGTPTRASRAAGYETVMIKLPREVHKGKGQETLHTVTPKVIQRTPSRDDSEVSDAGLDWTSSSDDELDTSPESRGFHRSNAPPPASTKRATQKSSSTCSGRHTKRRKSSSRHLNLEPVDCYEDCWLDPCHPLGGGSSLVGSGWLGYSLKRATQPSNASTPRNQSGSGYGQDTEEFEPPGLSARDNPSLSIADAQVLGAVHSLVQEECNEGDVQCWTDSQKHMAAALLREIGKDEDKSSSGPVDSGRSVVVTNDHLAGLDD